MPLDQTFAEQLVVLRGMTERTGALHEAQVLQLKMWPPIFLGSKGHTFSWDFESKRMTFDIQLPWHKKKVNARGLNALADAVRFLLGDDWTVVVRRDGVKLIESNGKPRESTTT